MRKLGWRQPREGKVLRRKLSRGESQGGKGTEHCGHHTTAWQTKDRQTQNAKWKMLVTIATVWSGGCNRGDRGQGDSDHSGGRAGQSGAEQGTCETLELTRTGYLGRRAFSRLTASTLDTGWHCRMDIVVEKWPWILFVMIRNKTVPFCILSNTQN